MNIYIYQLEDRPDLYKIGQTHRDVDERIAEQVGHLPIKYKILFKEKIDGVTDYDIMAELEKQGVTSTFRNEWYNCSYETLIEAIETCKSKVSKSRVNKDKVEWYVTALILLSRTKVILKPQYFAISVLLIPVNLLKNYIEYKRTYINKDRELIKIKDELLNSIMILIKKKEMNLIVTFFLSILIFLFIHYVLI